jgi:branched-chain amino acid transport system substrate-binding protein
MTGVSRRAAIGGAVALPLSMPSIIRAQTVSAPVKIGLLSDVGGTYQDNGGPGNKVAAELAVSDFGGTVLGRPIVVMQADDQNKPDVASSIARQWIDTDGVSLLLDGASSSAALAIQQISREKKRVYCTTSSIATALVGKACSPYFFQFMANAWSLSKGVGGTLTEQGNKTWFFIAVDNEAGTSLQSGAEQFILPAGGQVLGSVRAPVGTHDFSSYLVQAQASGAKVIGLANAGVDLQNCIKQAAEFGITKKGTLLATLVLEINDVISLGQDVCQGLVLATSFYWNLSLETRAFADRYVPKMGKPPGSGQACAYSSTMHWLKAVRDAGTLDADTVVAKMRQTPINDFFNKDVRIMPNGTVPHTTYLWMVKPSSEAKGKWDVFRQLGVLPSPTAFPPADAFGCPVTKA